MPFLVCTIRQPKHSFYSSKDRPHTDDEECLKKKPTPGAKTKDAPSITKDLEAAVPAQRLTKKARPAGERAGVSANGSKEALPPADPETPAESPRSPPVRRNHVWIDAKLEHDVAPLHLKHYHMSPEQFRSRTLAG